MHEAQAKQSQQSSQEALQPIGEARGDGLNHNFGKESEIEEKAMSPIGLFCRTRGSESTVWP